MKKIVAAIVTVYHKWSHADVIVGKILEGYHHDGQKYPELELAAMYVDQFPPNDLSRDLAKKFGFKIYPTIADAVCRGTDRLAVDGVLCIGEHGDYPKNERGQILYPRRRMFAEVCDVFEKSKRSVPVFNDKHLSAKWEDAEWMYRRARDLFVPLIAGSSLVVTWRRPDLTLPKDSELLDAVQVGYGPFEGYGFHALEALQCMVERRRGGESGVRAVTCLTGEAMWQALDRGEWSKELLEAALAKVPAHADGDYRRLTAQAEDAGVIQIEYTDGFKAAVAMMNGWAYEGDGGAFTFACRRKNQPIESTHFYLQQPDPFAHFAEQLRAIEHTIRTNHPAYPVERTLLTTGILEAAMISRAEKNRRIETPHLATIRYAPRDWPHATGDPPRPMPRAMP
ncbi:MAG: hypothetical protein N2039_02795 [Gemmataceae bacterium]|nr:hypothetical protein [Gemmataceae bacterium]